MIIDASRGEIQLDDLFNAIEHDKDQVTQALDIYGDYLKIKNDSLIDGKTKIDLLERILQLECIEKTVVNHNHENERSRINLKWTVLTECGIWYRKLNQYDKAIQYFEKANVINNRVSTIYYEMSMCYFELGNIYQMKSCLEKTIEIGNEHIHWKSLEQLICLYFILGNFSKCLEYIRIGYDHVATYQSMYDFGQICLVLLEKSQPSMKILINRMFINEIEYIIQDESLLKKVDELKENIRKFKEKLFQKKFSYNERPVLDERLSMDNFVEFGQYLVKKIRESNNDASKLCNLIDIKNFLPKQDVAIESFEQQPSIVPEEPKPQPTGHRKKRSSLPLNIDDYEKRRSARSITRVVTEDCNISTVDKLRRILSTNDNSSDDETDEGVPSPDNIDDVPVMLSDIPKETFPLLQIDFKLFLQSIEEKVQNGYRLDHIDLISDYINQLTKHSETLWPGEIRITYVKLFDLILDCVQYSSPDIDSNHLRACLCYVEIAIGSSKSDLSEDSIERFTCLTRLKTKFKSLGYCFGRLQIYLYLFKNSSLQQKQFEIDEILYRSLWISSLYYFLSDSQQDSLACIYLLQRLLPDSTTVVLPNLFNHTTISKSSVEKLYLRLKGDSGPSFEHSNSASSSQELTYILSRIAVAEENDELSLLIKKLDKKIKVFYANLKSQMHLQHKSLMKCYETLVNILNENQNLNEKENINVRNIFDQIIIQINDMIIKFFDDDIQQQDISLKAIEKITVTLIDHIMKRASAESSWLFKSVKPWILLYRVAVKRDSKKNEQFLILFVRTVHELFGKDENCLIESGALLEYFLIELIQIEHPDIRQYLRSNATIANKPSDESDESNEQKSKLPKVIDEIEQCIYCLYGLVLRKSKMKYLNDHNCRSIELTLDKASIVFYALRPRHVPGYEGRTSTITSETESLFQRFESMIEWDDEREQRRKSLLSHIADASSINSQGQQSEELMHLSDKPFQSNNALFEKDLYYLFADYYLKMGSKDAVTNEVSKRKAQEYYIKDLCLNTRRFDSWAGLTVIEFAKIEEFIIADDFDPLIFNVHMSASCFFRQAVSVESNNHTLWMEYAEITYILQSYCSKYREKSVDYVPDRSFLLNICKEAYEKANICTDNDENKEDWTYLYMMGKIEEKLHPEKIFDSLKKYIDALDMLHENKAVYPRKLGHHTSTSNSKGTLLGCHAVEMFYRIHASALKYLNTHNKESTILTIDQLNRFHELLTEMQKKPFATSYYEKSPIPNDAHANHLIPALYFPTISDNITDPWLYLYDKCIWLCIEGLYICIARYNRHYRALYRLAHFFHSSERYRNDRLALEFMLGGGVLELKNYPKIIGLYQERSKNNLYNGIWRIQPLDADRTGSFNCSMYKCTYLFLELLLQSEENLAVFIEVLRQLLEKPDPDKKYVREGERKMLCQHSIKNLFRTIKKKVLLKTRHDIEREGMQLIESADENDPSSVSLPILFDTSIKLYNLIKNYPDYYAYSRFNELVELTFQRYRSVLKYSSHLPENPKAENLSLVYTQKKSKPKKRPAATTEQPTGIKRQCIESASSPLQTAPPAAAVVPPVSKQQIVSTSVPTSLLISAPVLTPPLVSVPLTSPVPISQLVPTPPPPLASTIPQVPSPPPPTSAIPPVPTPPLAPTIPPVTSPPPPPLASTIPPVPTPPLALTIQPVTSPPPVPAQPLASTPPPLASTASPMTSITSSLASTTSPLGSTTSPSVSTVSPVPTPTSAPTATSAPTSPVVVAASPTPPLALEPIPSTVTPSTTEMPANPVFQGLASFVENDFVPFID